MLRTICYLVATLCTLLNMPPTSQHEALHHIFLQDEALFARAAAQVLGVIVQEPERVTVLNNDLTTVEPLERRADSDWKHWPTR